MQTRALMLNYECSLHGLKSVCGNGPLFPICHKNQIVMVIHVYGYIFCYYSEDEQTWTCYRCNEEVSISKTTCPGCGKWVDRPIPNN